MQTNIPNETRYCDADGGFVIFRNHLGREIGREKIGCAGQAQSVAERVTITIEAQRRPWKLTRGEYEMARRIVLIERGEEIYPSTLSGIWHAHESFVRQAKTEKKDIPDKVKADYPKIFRVRKS